MAFLHTAIWYLGPYKVPHYIHSVLLVNIHEFDNIDIHGL